MNANLSLDSTEGMPIVADPANQGLLRWRKLLATPHCHTAKDGRQVLRFLQPCFRKPTSPGFKK